MKNGSSKWITSEFARQNVQKFRARSSIILSSSSTILSDNSLLNVRDYELDKKTLSIFPKKKFQQPIRVIIDSQNRITPEHKIIHTKGKIWLMRLKLDKISWPSNVQQILMKENNRKIDIIFALKYLGRLKMNNIWVEAGSHLSGFLLHKKLVDEIIVYIAPKILGHKAKPMCVVQNVVSLFQALQFDFKNIRQIGPDIRIILSPKNNNNEHNFKDS
ncbi:MAG: bifunctional diaminohydroxyphosphoribosylaminopyrimidine deaminase/5-amino-6-(5-phosphoribosylamino)uracil reductase RibD [Buchnera aphidicola (Pentalonia nigronervosa)]|uniref:5-amino-6-(5-phosphoribosylamino)uracil reductase n=1 Tax=Buchnera aphidicola (Pentalonia nigronervosa) TaxID=1309793 RepID=A0A7H1B045_9GAMM|nr:MAG: bifunctional diaminohydroxyphosphoribosylaminopyrimidine deaminase/5-amino-6-(5-phosphoribosylamino)uracil reductase RibD [Buchnera aphidicola (Pentalonia nigronervosa)]